MVGGRLGPAGRWRGTARSVACFLLLWAARGVPLRGPFDFSDSLYEHYTLFWCVWTHCSHWLSALHPTRCI